MRMVCEHGPSKAMAEDHTIHGIVAGLHDGNWRRRPARARRDRSRDEEAPLAQERLLE